MIHFLHLKATETEAQEKRVAGLHLKGDIDVIVSGMGG